MEQVTGIGGFFFRCQKPVMVARWYRDHLGVQLTPTTYDETGWHQEPGPTAFSPFPKETSYFGRPEQPWMINFRVRDLDKIVQQLRHARIDVEIDPQEYPNGRFARLTDPEGNPIELWQPR